MDTSQQLNETRDRATIEQMRQSTQGTTISVEIEILPVAMHCDEYGPYVDSTLVEVTHAE